jgi:hypothetical protein
MSYNEASGIWPEFEDVYCSEKLMLEARKVWNRLNASFYLQIENYGEKCK